MARQKIVRVDAPESVGLKRPRRPGYVRLTLDVPVGLDIRIASIAKSVGKRKGDFAVRMLDQGCRNYKIDEVLRSAFPDLPGESETVE